MGEFAIKVSIAHPTDLARRADVEMLVDTGTTLSWVPRAVVDQLSLPRLPKRSFLIADGRTVERETAGAYVRVDGSETIVPVVVAEPGDGHLLGATALEALGFGVDPVNKQLIPRTLLAL